MGKFMRKRKKNQFKALQLTYSATHSTSKAFVPPYALASHKYGAKLEISILSLEVSSKLSQVSGGLCLQLSEFTSLPQKLVFPLVSGVAYPENVLCS